MEGLSVAQLANIIATSAKSGGKVLICGNGGLAAEAEHFTAELVGTFGTQGVFIPCLSLTVPSSLVTALINDMEPWRVYAHQVMVLGRPGDVLIGMTTSRSNNIMWALYEGMKRDIHTVVLCSQRHTPEAHFSVALPGENTAQVQESILQFLHQLAVQAKKAMA